ncbi:MAG: DMT family transporter [Halocynthiibacter sp.]
MICSMMLIPLGDTAGKILGTQYGLHPFFIAFTRFGLGLLLLLPFTKKIDPRVLLDPRMWLRGFFITAGIACILTALKTEPIGNVYAIFFIGPILSFFASVILLKEPFSKARAALLGLGFIGVLLVVRPTQDIGIGAIFALMAGTFYGSFLVASRWLSGYAHPFSLIFSQMAVGTLFLAIIGLPQANTLSLEMAPWILLSAWASGLGNILLVFAYQRAEATKLAPFVYIQLIAASLFGFVVWGDLPDMIACLGILLLLGSGLSTYFLRK